LTTTIGRLTEVRTPCRL